LRTIGKKQTKKTIITMGKRPKPTHEMNNGAKAILGEISMLTKIYLYLVLELLHNNLPVFLFKFHNQLHTS